MSGSCMPALAPLPALLPDLAWATCNKQKQDIGSGEEDMFGAPMPCSTHTMARV